MATFRDAVLISTNQRLIHAKKKGLVTIKEWERPT